MKKVFGIILLLATTAAIIYPLAANRLAERSADTVIAGHNSALSAAGDDERQEALSAAEEYNRRLLLGDIGGEDEYTALLNVDGTGMMGILTIPCIAVRLPVYHSTSADVLDEGVGHLYGSSLPVGGNGTHAVLSAHSGMIGQKMLTDLDKLALGDEFTLSVCGRELVYRVDRILTVLPDDTAALAIDPDLDAVTLVTCTPYGVNTHRLLVRGVALETAPTTASSGEVRRSTWTTEYINGLLIGAAVAVPTAGLIILKTKKGKNRNEKHID